MLIKGAIVDNYIPPFYERVITNSRFILKAIIWLIVSSKNGLEHVRLEQTIFKYTSFAHNLDSNLG